MLRLRWLLLLLALSTLFATWRVWWVGENRSAESLLLAAESRLDSQGFDRHVALRELDLALAMAEESGDRVIAEKALRRRAEVNHDGRSHYLTLEDCDRLLQTYRPNDPKVLDMAARSAFALGELTLAGDYAQFLAEVDPEQPSSHNLVAQVHRALAEEALQEIYKELDHKLPSRKARAGLASARTAAALPESAPHARSALEYLDSLAENEEVREAQRSLALRARAHLRAAREAWLTGLAIGRTGEAIQGIQQILELAGLLEEVITLGQSSLRKPRFRGAGGVLVRTALAQSEIGRVEEARKLISETKSRAPEILQPKQLDDETIVPWLGLLHELELWPDLQAAVSVVTTRQHLWKRNKPLRATLPYLRGVALFEQNRIQAALPSLTRAGRHSGEKEIIKGEQVLAWSVRATAERRMAMRAEEQRSLLEVTRVKAIPEPDGSRAARAFGEALERQSRLHEREQKYTLALEALAQATAYLPERREELEGRWRRMGELALEAEGRSLQELEQLFGLIQTSQDSSVLNSWATVELARRALDFGVPARATDLIRHSIKSLPYFPPLLQVAGEAYAANENWERAISTWLTQGRLFGYTAELAQDLSNVPRNRFPAADLIEWAALDPRRALLGGMVQNLVENDQTELALQAIRYLGGEGSSSQEYLLAANIRAAEHNWKGALANLERIPKDDPVFPEAAALLVRAATEIGDPRDPSGPLIKALAKVHAAPKLSAEGFAAAIDALLARGLAPEAGALSRLLDKRESIRERDLILRRAVVEVSLGNVDAAEEALDRAVAFQTGAQALVGRLLLAIDLGDEAAIETISFQLIVGHFRDDPLREGIARMLYGDLERALPLLASADQMRSGLDIPSHLAFLTGLVIASGDGPNDSTGDAKLDQEIDIWRSELTSLPESIGTRQVFALLLAMDSDPWQGWVATRLAQAAPALASHSWALLLSASTSASLGRLDEARRLALPLTKPNISQPWAWILLEQIALERSGGEVDLEVVRARVGRVLAIGAKGLDPEQTPKLVAEVLVYLKRPKSALRILTHALQDRSQQTQQHKNDLLISIARTAIIARDNKQALSAFEELLHSADDDVVEPLVPEILDLLAQMFASHGVTDSAYFARLQGLAARFPRDPSPVRAVAQRLLASGESLSTSPVSRALARLERFRDSTRNEPLEHLRRGEATLWVQMIADLDPIAAEKLAHTELLALPYSIELWRTWADSLRGVRRYEQALGVFRTLAAVVPDTSSMKSLAQVLLEQKQDPLLAYAAATQARKRLGNASADPQLALIEAIAKTYTTDAGYKAGVREMRALLKKSRRRTFPLATWQVAKPLVETLIRRGRKGDLKLVQAICTNAAILVAETDDLRADWFRAIGLVVSLELNNA